MTSALRTTTTALGRAPGLPPEVAADLGEGAVADALAAAALTLARRFAAGATMWCVAPHWPAHGGHVAVEFVHPVIVGKRALPARHVEGPTVVDRLRLLARPGDVLLVVGPGDDPRTGDLMRRAEAWGLTRIWLGAGRRPPQEVVDHLVWWDRIGPDQAARSGDVVILYHLLWELTHVVFEHPGLLAAGTAGTEEACITCSDEARLAEVQTVGVAGSAEVLVAGHLESVDVTLLDHIEPGDLVLVHAGVALAALQGVGPIGAAGAAGAEVAGS